MMKITSATLIEHVQDVFSKLNSPNRRLQGMSEAFEYLQKEAIEPDAELDGKEFSQFIWLLYQEQHKEMPEGSPMLSENFVKAKAGAVFDVISAAIDTDGKAETVNFGAGETEEFNKLMEDPKRLESVVKQLIEGVYTLTDEQAEEAFDYMDEDDNKTIDVEDAKISFEREAVEMEDFDEEGYNGYMKQMFGSTSVDLATFKKGMDATVQCSEELTDVIMNAEGDPAVFEENQDKYATCVETELKKTTTTTTTTTTTAPAAVTTEPATASKGFDAALSTITVLLAMTVALKFLVY